MIIYVENDALQQCDHPTKKYMSTFEMLVMVKGGQFHTMITMIDIYKQWESYSMTTYT